MIAKTSKLLLMLYVVSSFSGCCEKKIVVKKVPVEVKVPVKCKVPQVACDFNKSTYTGVIKALVDCTQRLRAAAKVCQ